MALNYKFSSSDWRSDWRTNSQSGFNSEAILNNWSSYVGVGTQALTTFLNYQNAKNERTILKCQSEIYKIQAQSYRNAAEDALRQGNQQVAAITYQAGQKKAAAKVSMAAAGIQVGTGSSAEILASYDITKEMQVNQTLANAVNASFGYQRQSVNFENKSIATEAARSGINPWAVAVTTGIKGLGKNKETGSVGLDDWTTVSSSLKDAFGW